MRLLHFLILVLLLQNCAPAVTYQYKKNEEEAVDPAFIFATFKIQKDSTNEVSIELLEQKKISGSMKLEPPEVTGSNFISVRQLNSTGDYLSQVKVEHPLLKSVEHVNSQGAFEKKTLDLKQAEFFVRMPLMPNASFIEVLETTGAATTQKLKIPIVR